MIRRDFLKKLAAAGLEGLDPARLTRRVEGKAETLFAQAQSPSVALAEGLQQALDETLAALPIPKVMSYQLADGETTVQFVRPAHCFLCLCREIMKWRHRYYVRSIPFCSYL